MLNNKRISISDLLRDFERGRLGKTAEELEGEDLPVEPAAPVMPAPDAAPAGIPPEALAAAAADEEDDDEEHHENCDCDVCNMQDALDDLDDNQSAAVDAARALRDMADEYIDKHDEEIVKEAALFGEIFARSACETMSKSAAYRYGYGYDDDDFEMVKQAAEAAYSFTISKLASEEAYALAAQAVSDSASAAKTLVENMGQEEDEDPEAAAGQAAAEAYNETLARIQAGQGAEPEAEEASPEEQQAAAQNGYDQAAEQLAAAQAAQPAAPEEQQAAAQNGYDQAMGQLGAQQQMPQGY